jgi:hypothetical protein
MRGKNGLGGKVDWICELVDTNATLGYAKTYPATHG